MKRVAGWLAGLVFRNAGWKLLALALAVLIWILVASEPELATFVAVPLQYKNLPPELEISSTLIESVYLELRGPAGELRSMTDARRPSVVLDMSKVRPGERTFVIDDDSVRLPQGVKLLRAAPSQVRFDFERRSYRDVPVRVRFTPDPNSGYEVADYAVSPTQLPIVGPESHVARINVAVSDPVDLTGVVGRAEFHVNAFIEDSYVRFASPPTVAVTVTMRKKQS
jgi:hypothetical protein